MNINLNKRPSSKHFIATIKTQMTKILTIATASTKPDQLKDTNHALYPRVDYLELQNFLDVDILDYTSYDKTSMGNMLRSWETKVHSDLYLTVLGLLKENPYRLVFAMSERVGIPFAALNRLSPTRKPFVSLFQCWSKRQEQFMTSLNLFNAMDGIAVHCQSMKDHFIQLGAVAEKVHLIHYSIDHNFFAPLSDVEQEKNLIMSIGEIRSRDYESLFKAAKDLPVQLAVAASGSWYAREAETDLQVPLPQNVQITSRLPRAELRKLYARSQFVVIPIKNVLFSAGATATLEASSMGRAVIAFRSQGIVDYVIDGETGILVPPGDVQGMKEAIQFLQSNPQEAKRLGDNARQRIVEELNLDNYVAKITRFLQTYLP